MAGRPERVGAYVLGNSLGEGGQGEVFHALEEQSGLEVALKRVWLGRDEQMASGTRKQWRRETKLLQSVDHTAVARVVGYGEVTEGTPRDPFGYVYIVYELIPGGMTLYRFLRERSADVLEVAEMGAALGSGLQRLHDAGIYHRDVTPKNVMLREGDLRRPVLIDFGTVKADSVSTHTTTGRYLATAGYAPPELFWSQATMREVGLDWRSCDRWSFAKTMADALAVATGEDYSTLAMERGATVLSLLRGRLPQTAEPLATALDPNPAKRTASVAELASSLLAAVIVDGGRFDLTAPGLGTLRASLERELQVPLNIKSYQPVEVFLWHGNHHRRSVQLVLWRSRERQTWVALAGRNGPAVQVIKALASQGRVLGIWLRKHGTAVSVAFFDKGELSSEPGDRVIPLLQPLASLGTDSEAGAAIVRTLDKPDNRVYFALPQPLLPKHVIALARGEFEPLVPLVELWRALLSVDKPPTEKRLLERPGDSSDLPF